MAVTLASCTGAVQGPHLGAPEFLGFRHPHNIGPLLGLGGELGGEFGGAFAVAVLVVKAADKPLVVRAQHFGHALSP